MSAGSKRKGIKAIAIVLAVLIVTGGGLYAFFTNRTGKAVEVEPVSQWELGWMPDQMTLYGGIESAGAQSIFADKDVSVTEMLVSEGDEVRAGDPLLRYDATLDSIDLELKQMEMQQLEYDLVDYYKEYRKYARTDYVSTLPSPSPSAELAAGTSGGAVRPEGSIFTALFDTRNRLIARITGASRRSGSLEAPDVTLDSRIHALSASDIIMFLKRAETDGQTYNVRMAWSDQSQMYQVDLAFPASITLNLQPQNSVSLTYLAAPVTGTGTELDPYEYLISTNITGPTEPTSAALVMGIGESFIIDRLAYAAKTTGVVYANLKDARNPSSFTIEAVFRRQAVPTPTPSPTPTASPTPTPSPTKTPTPTPTESPASEDEDQETIVIPSGSGMTRAEREAMARAAAKKIRDAELEYKQLKLDLQNLYLRGTDGVVRATIDGHVAVCNDPADTADGQLLLQVKGNEGYFVRCSVGEMELDQVPVGAELSGFSYDSGTECTGRVVEVGTVPLSNQYYYGGRSMSRYEVRIFIEDGTSLMPGYYIEFQLESDASEGAPDALYLYQAYVREVDGMKYVCVAKDGVLAHVEVETGKVMYGYVEIKGGVLTREDYIAFPYSKDAKEGAPVTIPEDATVY